MPLSIVTHIFIPLHLEMHITVLLWNKRISYVSFSLLCLSCIQALAVKDTQLTVNSLTFLGCDQLKCSNAHFLHFKHFSCVKLPSF